jgi:hypothetical protein
MKVGVCSPAGNLRLLAGASWLADRVGAYIVVGDHLSLGDDLLVPRSQIILLCDINPDQRSTVNLSCCQSAVTSTSSGVVSDLLFRLLRLLGSRLRSAVLFALLRL